MIAEDAETLLEEARRKIREGIDLTEDEMRQVIIACRAGRRSAAEGQARQRAKPIVMTPDTLFKT